MSKGKVWLVGAGPGDVGLFTCRGKEVLAAAQVVVYDVLVGQGVLAMIPPEAIAINVGKRSGRHVVPQKEINRILLEQAQKGYRVVRLKGGDPFLFGRGGEELTLLKEHGIDFEIVPGVTSPIAVPAYNGIPVTHREFCSSVHIITGHRRAGKEYDIDFDALVRTGGTLVFLMGISAMEDICNRLIEAGMPQDMPAAALQQGTTARQKRIVATVATLHEECERQGIETPAIIIVGKVCALHEKFAWYEELPLFGWRVLVTRPGNLGSDMSAKLRRQGAEVLELPAIRTEPIEDNEALSAAMEQLDTYEWLAFTSPTGVKVFFEQMYGRKCDVRRLGTVKIAAIGEGTKRALQERGLLPDLVPGIYDGEHLAYALAEKIEAGSRILIPRAQNGNKRLVEILEAAKGVVTDIATYRTCYEKQEIIDERREFERGKIDCVVFTSASTVRGFAEATKGLDYTKVKAACISRQTCKQAEKYKMQTWVADKATADSLTELVIKMKGECKTC